MTATFSHLHRSKAACRIGSSIFGAYLGKPVHKTEPTYSANMRHVGIHSQRAYEEMDSKSGYDGLSTMDDEERFSCTSFVLDDLTFLRVIFSFCLSPSTSANWRLSWEYRSCISLSSFSIATCFSLISNISLINSLISLKLLKIASSSLCCFRNELKHR